MMRIGLSLVALLFFLLAAPLLAQDNDDALRILTLEDKIEICRTENQGGARSDCLGTLAVQSADPAPCDHDPSGVCRKAVGTYLMQQCGADPARSDGVQLACRMAVATEFKSADACDAADERDVCLMIVASETRDPKVITDRVTDKDQRDDLLAAYASKTGDDSVVSQIEDNLRADQARMMALGKKAADGDPAVDASQCNTLRGNYADKHAEDLDAETYRTLCVATVNLAKSLRAMLDTAETPGERAKAEAKIATVMKKIESGEITARDMAGLPPEEDFDALDMIGDETLTLVQNAARACRPDEALRHADHLRQVRPDDGWLGANEARLRAEVQRRRNFAAAYDAALAALDRVAATRNAGGIDAAEAQGRALLDVASPSCPDEAARAQQVMENAVYAREVLLSADEEDESGGFVDSRENTGDDAVDVAADGWGAAGGFDDERTRGAGDDPVAPDTEQTPAGKALAQAQSRYADEVRACDFGGAGQVLDWMGAQNLDPGWAAAQRPQLAQFAAARQESLRQLGVAQAKVNEALAQKTPYTARSIIADARIAIARAAEGSWCDASTIGPMQQQIVAISTRIDNQYQAAEARNSTIVAIDAVPDSTWNNDDRAAMEDLATGLIGILQQSAQRPQPNQMSPDDVFEKFRQASPYTTDPTNPVSPSRSNGATGGTGGPGVGEFPVGPQGGSLSSGTTGGNAQCNAMWADVERKSQTMARAAQKYEASAGNAERFKAALTEYRAACRSLQSSIQQFSGSACKAPFDPGLMAQACP